MTESVFYAYAVVRNAAGLDTALEGVVGVAGAPVHMVSEGPGSDLTAAVSPVPAEEFQERALRRHLEDLDWLEAVARAHHSVIEALAAHTTVLPLRLATVYLDDGRIRAMLHEDAELFSQTLQRLAGQLEWGVKIYVEPQPDTRRPGPASAAGSASAADTTADTGPGRAYLRARRAQRHSREECYEAAREAAERVESIGRAMATDHARHRVQQGELATGAGENVVNDAYLLTHEATAEFRKRVLDAAHGLPGVRIDVTGPWAPYSFVAPPGTEDPATDRPP
ncbi:GvpL/GvpF family gas vesicle protein [Streptomyces broussonetiae]|uniref:Gas vesicle protein n=1 Tax=Streptomyces broussonetiae TaxID=2686304 RepID=A0A6I6NH87_9ACTN|nr:GvpL/GvpF family gas vesicle protein [Streptomyces broussonetiae]QHA08305.1 gas vesicle protein [Streptomyces broussonetiae]